MNNKYLDYKLCFIDSIDDISIYKLYFTSKFDGQWGDDWNDRPAISNAGTPYDDDRDIYSIFIGISGYGSITFGGKVYSVEDMNTKKACWLIYENIFFEGGDTLKTCLDKINSYNSSAENYNKIEVYIKMEMSE